ncbi:MAG: T9SS type A sorting domain-containing protein [Bacteroidetes bacterium]|nr:T9SS type A sorting domain-containing protein [Bacteroidota bacterium]
MKKILGFIVLLSFIISPGHSQTWPKTYTGMNAWADWVIQTYDKGYVILGTKTNYKIGWIIKTDINGNILWDKKLGSGQYTIYPGNIEQTQDNGFIIGGTTMQIGNQEDAFILKLNSCAELEWCKIIYTPTIHDDLGWCAKPTLDGGYVLLGFGNDPTPLNRINLFRFNGVGQLLWRYYYPPDSLLFNEDATDVYVDSDGFLLTGEGYYPGPGIPPGYGAKRPYYIKTDTAGITLWKTIYGKGTYYWGDAAKTIKGANNNYYSAARHSDSTGNDYPALIKLFHDGDTSYNANLTQNTYLGIATTINMKDDTTLILGVAWSPDNNAGPVGLVKTDTLGNVLKGITFLNNDVTIAGTAKSFDNKYFSVSTLFAPSGHIYAWKVNSNLEYDSLYTHPFVYDSLCPHPIVSDTIFPNCDLIVDVQEPIDNPETTHMKVFPNPASTHLSVEFPKYLKLNSGLSNFQSTTIYHQWNYTTLEVYNLSGERMFQKEIPKGQAQLEMDVSSWSKGMYFFRLIYNKQMVAGEKVIVE